MIGILRALIPARYREDWRRTQLRLRELERKHAETEMLLELVLSDATYSPVESSGLHAQASRRAIVKDLFQRVGFVRAVETGTYLGSTAGYLATELQVPVHSSESVARYHHAARRMLRNVPSVRLHLGDSRAFLREMASDPAVTSQPTFFYLDAHWYQDLPLADEIEIICGAWTDFVALIDDFEVPGDPGYVCDDYGPGKRLDTRYLAPQLERHELGLFFPVARAADESGSRVGYAVVASRSCVDRVAESVLLRRA
jgi:hypothetical protein